MMPCRSRYPSVPLSVTLANPYARSASVEGFWAQGLAKDGAIRVGDDDEGA